MGPPNDTLRRGMKVRLLCSRKRGAHSLVVIHAPLMLSPPQVEVRIGQKWYPATVTNVKGKPQSFDKLLGELLLDEHSKHTGTLAALSGKVVGLYFAAGWCNACQKHLPELIKVRLLRHVNNRTWTMPAAAASSLGSKLFFTMPATALSSL